MTHSLLHDSITHAEKTDWSRIIEWFRAIHVDDTLMSRFHEHNRFHPHNLTSPDEADTCLYGSVVRKDSVLHWNRLNPEISDSDRANKLEMTDLLTSSEDILPSAGNDMHKNANASSREAHCKADNQVATENELQSTHGKRCEECEDSIARIECEECGLVFCVQCDAHWHRKGKLSTHIREKKVIDPLFGYWSTPENWTTEQVLYWLELNELSAFKNEAKEYRIKGSFLLSDLMTVFLDTTSAQTRGQKKKLVREIQKLIAQSGKDQSQKLHASGSSDSTAMRPISSLSTSTCKNETTRADHIIRSMRRRTLTQLDDIRPNVLSRSRRFSHHAINIAGLQRIGDADLRQANKSDPSTLGRAVTVPTYSNFM